MQTGATTHDPGVMQAPKRTYFITLIRYESGSQSGDFWGASVIHEA